MASSHMMPPPPPGGPMEMVFSFDTTGSMSACLDQVRAQLANLIGRLFADIPGLRVAVFAHGDYCDLKEYGYVTQHIDFTSNQEELCQFIQNVGGTGGGDFEECYELVLSEVHKQLSWQPGTQRALVMIGDATPHPVDDPQNVNKLDWKEETQSLASDMGVTVYAVQCLNNTEADHFYQHLAATTGGRHLRLDELDHIVDLLLAVCYRERGVEFFEAYEKEVRHREGAAIRGDLHRMFEILKDAPKATSEADDDEDGMGFEATRGLFDSPPGSPGSSAAPVTPAPVDTRSLSSGSSRTSRRSTANRRRPAGPLTRSRTHPMRLRDRTTLKKASAGRPKQTPSQRTYEKAIRELEANVEVTGQDLTWSRWRQVMVPDTTTKVPSGTWETRPNGHPGMRRNRLFRDNMSSSTTSPAGAIFEVAVQPPSGRRKIPVFAAVTQGETSPKRSWERRLLGSPRLRGQVDRVLQRGCKLHVRRALFTETDAAPETSVKSSAKEIRTLLTRTYDYAWRARYNPTAEGYTQRAINVRGTCISDLTSS